MYLLCVLIQKTKMATMLAIDKNENTELNLDALCDLLNDEDDPDDDNENLTSTVNRDDSPCQPPETTEHEVVKPTSTCNQR